MRWGNFWSHNRFDGQDWAGSMMKYVIAYAAEQWLSKSSPPTITENN